MMEKPSGRTAKRLCGCVSLRVNNSTVFEYCPLHKAAPDLLKALAEPLADASGPMDGSFATDLETIAYFISEMQPKIAAALQDKAEAIRAAVAAARGEAN